MQSSTRSGAFWNDTLRPNKILKDLDIQDTIALAVSLALLLLWSTKTLWWTTSPKPLSDKTSTTHDIPGLLQDAEKDCIVFWGSQTGTAEGFASRFVKEGKSRFKLQLMTADIQEYDFNSLADVSSDKVVIFFLATYGDGEPTENAVTFFDTIASEGSELMEPDSLANLRYGVFGFGNSTYEHFNAMALNIDKALRKYGAQRLGQLGLGDEALGTMEEEYLTWKETVWADLRKNLDLEENRISNYEPTVIVTENSALSRASSQVYLGEHSSAALNGIISGPFNNRNPFLANVRSSRELFANGDRNCIFLELVLAGSGLSYETGDHIAVWPTNSNKEVDRFLRVLGLLDKRYQVIDLNSVDEETKIQFPTPTTYEAVARFYMDICGPVSREFLAVLKDYAPHEAARREITRLSTDKDYFSERVHARLLNIAQLLSLASQGSIWHDVPFASFVEGMTRLKPRFYSIASSAAEEPTRVSIVAVVQSKKIHHDTEPFLGVATNYLLAIKESQNGNVGPSTHAVLAPREEYHRYRIPVHIRRSKFRLPSSPSTPIIMIGPGTGVAPFRGFIRERAKQVREGQTVGQTLLFFGCRKSNEDFICKEELEDLQHQMGGVFQLFTAFSREREQKLYVQHRLRQMGKQVNQLLQAGAHIYICGDAANMAREVHSTLIHLVAEHRSIGQGAATYVLQLMKLANCYQVGTSELKYVYGRWMLITGLV
ncbi:NADPH--cytochrome P450 reductase [Fusarium oxysporum f. sp. cubense]|uniref:NADPH--cytochrome P450 reductase n=1 Tax=Fusarium oxysporum f. sp. cubense TaxID=61366 RepID=A0A559L7K7_FUSOC|nr:NADPH--cytochrome P450 reductase [Fusarium oxysporum f. sp. cubense]